MKEFYIFKINDEYTKLTKKNPYNLYMILSGIKKSSIKDLHTAFSIFDSVINQINKNYFLNVLGDLKKGDCFTIYDNTYNYNDYFNNETTKIIYHSSYLKIITNKTDSIVLKRLTKIKNGFLVDFVNKEYFWLDSIENKVLV